MAKGTKQIATIAAAAKAYGGMASLETPFSVSIADVRLWKNPGIPTRYELGMFHGLAARGFEMGPKLLGVERIKRWSDGVA